MTTTVHPSDQEVQQAIVDALWRRVISDAAGTSEPDLARYAGHDPRTRFWLGTLAPEASLFSSTRSLRSIERFNPAAQGFSFRIPELPTRLTLTVSFAIWLALHPTLDEQRQRAGLTGDDDDEQESWPRPGTDGQVGLSEPTLRPAKVRIKVPVRNVEIEATIQGTGEQRVGATQISAAITRTLGSLPAGTVPFRPLARRAQRLREADLTDQASWASWERGNLDTPAVPTWSAAVDIEVRDGADGSHEVLVMLVNQSPAQEDQFVDAQRTQGFPSWACDPVLYEAEIACTPSSSTVPYLLEQIPDSYRYDRTVAALGMNAAVETCDGAFRTAFAAVAKTDRAHPRTTASDGSDLDTHFTTLKEDPLPALDRLLGEARQWTTTQWTSTLQRMRQDPDCLPSTLNQAEADARAADQELDWVERGVQLLRTDPELLTAFKLMNQTMEAVAAGRYDAWRPFQLAFILGCLPGVRDPALAPAVDILWFSTGGGKTEAYLGLNVLHLFYGRLKGRTGGSQTWARFPLRLLSLQQTQRIADSVINAELVRRRHPRLQAGEPFSVGYYVGAVNTPNSISLPGSRFYDGWDPFDQRNAESCRVLELCPACRDAAQPPVVRFDRDSFTMIHECPNPRCVLHGERLPVFVIDDDIHRWAPSVLVGTVDKLAQLGQQANFRILLGQAQSRCPKHGYSAWLDRCGVFGCQDALRPVPSGFGGLDFEIQDELHLLNESLGALDGNFETLFQAVAAEAGTPAIRIIGATATIEGYREQSAHLYRRDARRFPIPGPTKAESFWAYEQSGDPLRTYIAMLPRGTTMLNASYFVTQTHWRFIEEAMTDVATFTTSTLRMPAAAATQVMRDLTERYEVMVTYALRKQDLERYAKDILEDSEVCPADGNYDSITGDVEFWSVRDVLNRLESPPPAATERIRVLGATTAISHGVDVNRLNAMTVMGMPKQTSEFIQATARVGRRFPAVVFALINPMRERDVSHFRYFRKYAEYLDRLVEPVPVNRESLPVLKQVLPGGLMALLLQIDEPRWLYPGGQVPRPRRDRLYHARGVARALDEGFLSQPQLVERLRRAFAIDGSDPRFLDHLRAIDEFVEINLRNILLHRGSGKSTKEELDPPPPRSLRDVETSLDIIGER